MLRNRGNLPGLASAFLLLLPLAGCMANFIRDDAQEQLRAGHYEKALKAYEDGIARYPDSTILRAGMANAREAVFTRLISAAAAARTSGNDEQAEQILQRALAINPNDERAKSMLLDLERDRRQKVALADAKALIAKGLLERALMTIETALKDNAKNPELLALQRQLELDVRRNEIASTRLAETRPIALDFRDANLRMVLEVLTRNSGINFVVDKDVRQDLRTTVFLRQTKLEDALELITATNQLAYKVLDPSTVLVYPKTPDKVKEYQDLVIRAFYLSSADAKQTATLLKTMLKIREPFVDEKLNLVIVRETPETIRLAERLVALHDLSEPELMMEVEVLEIKSSRLTELGVNFPNSFTLTPLPPSGASGLTLGNLRGLNGDRVGVTVPNALVNLRREVGDTNILANPKIRARNREKAKILIGDKLPVVTTTANANGFVAESVQYVDVGIKVEVEPNIYLDDDVAIKVGLEVSSLAKEVRTASGSLVYQIGTRTANTVLRLRDGETQILAGLISNEERMSANRVPGVGDLPLVGRLFSSQRDDGQRTEIVLSITPHIIRNIRRPDLNQAEFWSGTENNVRSRPLALPGMNKPAENANPAGQPGASEPGAPNSPATVPPAAVQPNLSLVLEAPSDVKVGETFAVNVRLKSDVPVRGLPLQLEFDPKALEVVEVEEGSFFKQDNVAVSMTKNIEQKEGKASVGLLRNVAEGAKGEGTVIALKFKAIAAGAAEVKVAAANPIANRALTIPELPKAVAITVK